MKILQAYTVIYIPGKLYLHQCKKVDMKYYACSTELTFFLILNFTWYKVQEPLKVENYSQNGNTKQDLW